MAKKKPKPNAEYTLPDKFPRVEKLVLGLDPGSRNFGIAAVGFRNNKVGVLANSVLTNPVNDLVSFAASSDRFLKEIDRWVQKFQPNGFVAERFQTRGNGGPLIEQVSAMLGLIRGRYPHIPIKLTVASAWKNKVRRRFDTDLKIDTYPTIDVQPHQLDASLIGIYGIEFGIGRDVDYSLEKICAQCERTSLIELKRRRTK